MEKERLLILVGKNIRRFRKDRGLSQDQLAYQTGLHRTYIGSVERGERNISVINLVKIAQALEVDPGLFLTNEDEKSN